MLLKKSLQLFCRQLSNVLEVQEKSLKNLSQIGKREGISRDLRLKKRLPLALYCNVPFLSWLRLLRINPCV